MSSLVLPFNSCNPCNPLFDDLPIEIENIIIEYRDSHIHHLNFSKCIVELQEKVYKRTAGRLQLCLQQTEVLREWRMGNDLERDTWYECFYDIIIDDRQQAYEFVDHLSLCNCCSRHMCNKPDYYDLFNKTNIDNVNKNIAFHHSKCKCNCRHISRMICKVIIGNQN